MYLACIMYLAFAYLVICCSSWWPLQWYMDELLPHRRCETTWCRCSRGRRWPLGTLLITWDFIDRMQLSAWSIDPTLSTTSYHGRVVIVTSYGTLQIHRCVVWKTPPFLVPLFVMFRPFWTALVAQEWQGGQLSEGVGTSGRYGCPHSRHFQSWRTICTSRSI
jgi:hypothetical protein